MIVKEQYENLGSAGYYNVGPDETDCINTGKLVDMFCQKWGEGAKWINQYDGGPHEANFLKLDCSKLKRTFEWSTTWGVSEALDKVIEWTRVYFDKGDIPAVMDKQIEAFNNNMK